MTLHSVNLAAPGCELLLVNEAVIYGRVTVKSECTISFWNAGRAQ
jgi:hypothetical protein